jgi:hypothetical protein
VQNFVGDLHIENYADDKDILFRCDDGSGGLETYFFLDGSTGHTQFPDDKRVSFGSATNLTIHHSTNSFINNYVGDLTIRNNADNKDIRFESDDGSGGVTEYFRLDGSAASSGNLFTIFPDNSYIGLGSNGTGDFIMAHNGTNTTLANYTGNLQISNNADDGDIIFESDDGSGGTAEYFRLLSQPSISTYASMIMSKQDSARTRTLRSGTMERTGICKAETEMSTCKTLPPEKMLVSGRTPEAGSKNI